MHYQADPALLSVILAVVFGVGSILLARRLNLPSIALLLVTGIILGPDVLHLVAPDALGKSLEIFVSLAIAVILFEGGMSLDFKGFRQAGRVIQMLLTVGVLITWLGTAAAVRLLFGFSVPFCLLAGSLVIVTGPTVILPLLRRIRVTTDVFHILVWEGVLIDPIGVFISILCFEIVVLQGTAFAVTHIVLRLITGAGVGFIAGIAAYYMIKHAVVDEEHTNIFALSMAILTYGICDVIEPESGLLGVVVAGLVLGIKKPAKLKSIKKFKQEITEILIGMLFILLAAKLDLDEFALFGVRGLVLIGVVILVVRPLAIAASTGGSRLNLREKLFLAWIAPRGIVAASMATIFTLRLSAFGLANAPFLEVFTFTVIAVTVIVQGLSAKPIAFALKVIRPDPTGWLLVGAHALSEQISVYLKEKAGRGSTIVDTNPAKIHDLQLRGFDARQVNALDRELRDDEGFVNIGNVLALTDNEQLNVLICQNWSEVVGEVHCYRWAPAHAESAVSARLSGRPVLKKFPRPSVLAAELSHGDAHLFEAGQADAGRFEADGTVFVDREGVLDMPADTKEARTLEKPLLMLERENVRLFNTMHSDLILRLQPGSLEDLFGTVLEQVCRRYPAVHKKQVFAELIAREQSFPTAIGKGIAIPHAYCDQLDNPVCAVVRVPEGVTFFNAFDNTPVRLVFVLLSTSGDPEQHLMLLAEIARLVTHDADREKLIREADSDEVLEAIRSICFAE